MQPRKNKRWISVLTGVIILSGGVPLSARLGAAQPVPPDVIQGAAPLGHALESNDWHIERVLKQRNQELEKLKGRKLEDSERVKLARQVVLQPHPDSPVKDVIVIWYELSDGSVGRHFTGPMVDVNFEGPLGWHTETIDVEEGWYIVRFLTPEEIEARQKATEAPAKPIPFPEEAEPLSFLDRVLKFFSPSEAVACPPGSCQPFPEQITRGVVQRLAELTNTGVFVDAEDGVKLTWVKRDAQTCSPKIIAVPPPRCHVDRGWRVDGSCNITIPTQLWGAVMARHSDTYISPDEVVRVDLMSQVWANTFFIMPSGNCTFTPFEPTNLFCLDAQFADF